MHKAGARNSLTYLTGLETPAQWRWIEKETETQERGDSKGKKARKEPGAPDVSFP